MRIKRGLVAAVTAFAVALCIFPGVKAEAKTKLPFSKKLELGQSSGAGAWERSITIKPNGTCELGGHDANMGVPEVWFTEAYGHFYDIKEVSSGKYTMKFKNSKKNNRKTKKKREDGCNYYTDYSSGYKSGTKFTLYVPGYPMKKIPKEVTEFAKSIYTGLSKNGKTCMYLLYSKDDGLPYASEVCKPIYHADPLTTSAKKNISITEGDSKTVKINWTGKGKLSCSSSKASVADSSLSGSGKNRKLTIDAVKAGSATITVRGAGSTLKFKVKVKAPVRLYTNDSTDISFEAGSSADVTLIYTADKGNLSPEESGNDILDWDWGDWNGDKCKLTISASEPGTTTLKITADHTDDTITLHITVTEPDYSKKVQITKPTLPKLINTYYEDKLDCTLSVNDVSVTVAECGYDDEGYDVTIDVTGKITYTSESSATPRLKWTLTDSFGNEVDDGVEYFSCEFEGENDTRTLYLDDIPAGSYTLSLEEYSK